MKTKLFLSDLDGTLLNAQSKVSLECKKILNNYISAGGLFSVATARSLSSAQSFIAELGIKLPVILYNGAQIYCPKQTKYIHSYFLPQDMSTELVNCINSADLNPIVHAFTQNDELRVFFQKVDNKSEAAYVNSRLSEGDVRFRMTTNFLELAQYSTIEIMAIGKLEKIRLIERQLKRFDNLTYTIIEDTDESGDYWLEIQSHQAEKGIAAEFLKKYTGAKSLVCFGDQKNDLSMFRVADKALVVENGVDELKDIADGHLGHHNLGVVSNYINDEWKSYNHR